MLESGISNHQRRRQGNEPPLPESPGDRPRLHAAAEIDLHRDHEQEANSHPPLSPKGVSRGSVTGGGSRRRSVGDRLTFALVASAFSIAEAVATVVRRKEQGEEPRNRDHRQRRPPEE